VTYSGLFLALCLFWLWWFIFGIDLKQQAGQKIMEVGIMKKTNPG
jgi:hypothetical protein